MGKIVQTINLYVSVLCLIGYISNLNAQPNSFYFCNGGFAGSLWTSRGQNPTLKDAQEVGAVFAVAAHPSNLQTIYAGGGRKAGLWKTTDGGINWSIKTDALGIPSLGIYAIAIDPGNPNNILAGGYTESFGWNWDLYGIGVLKSTDGGDSWQCTTGIASFPGAHKYIRVIRFHPTTPTPGVVLAAGGKFIYRSTDGGSTWSTVYSSSDNNAKFVDIEFQISNPNVVYASTNSSTPQLVVSTDAGQTWSDKTAALQGAASDPQIRNVIRIDVTPADQSNIYAIYNDGDNTGNTYIKKSSNNGNSWSKISTFKTNLIYNSSSAYWGSMSKHEFEVSNTNSTHFYAGAGIMKKSIDNGSTWTYPSQYNPVGPPINSTHADIRSLIQLPATPSGDYLIMGNDGGVAKTMDGGITWWNLNGIGSNGSGFSISECFSVATFNNSDNLVVGFMDCGTKLYDAVTNTWSYHIIGGDGGWSEVDYANDNIVYAMSWDNIFKSIDGGITFKPINNPEANRNILGKKFQIDPTNHNRLWWGGKNLHMYDATTGSWSEKFNQGINNEIAAIQVAPSDGNVVYIAYSGAIFSDSPHLQVNKLFKSTDGGSNWTDITINCPVYKWKYINNIIIDPGNSNRIWAGCAGYWEYPAQGIGYQRVIYSNNGGNSWTDFSTGLPPFSVNHLVYKEGSDDEIYAGTDAGVYRWNKLNNVWECFNNGFPPVIVTKLEINNCKNKIVASTWGRGVWEAPLHAITTISTSQIWGQNLIKIFSSDLIIPSGVTLTVNGIIKMVDNRKITIAPGGRLIINGGTLTNACPNQMWQGITISGDNTQSALPNVEVINGGKIENAHCAITLNENGWVYAEDAHFINNTKGVLFRRDAKGGTFKRTNFELNDNYFGENTPGSFGDKRDFDSHIQMKTCGAVSVEGCTFSSTAQNTTDKNTGIYLIDSDLTIKEECPSGCPSPCPNCFCSERCMIKTKFSGFRYAIMAANTGSLPKFKVRFTTFEDIYDCGIILAGVYYPELIKNEFIISRHNTYGLDIQNSTGYKIEENSFKDKYPAQGKITTGSLIRESGKPENEIYKNKYYDLAIAQQFSGKNSNQKDTLCAGCSRGNNPNDPQYQPLITGLQTLCNEFYTTQNKDVQVGFSSGNNMNSIRKEQGSKQTPAGNLFAGTPVLNIDNTMSQHTFTYYYDKNAPQAFPNSGTSNVILASTTVSNGCPSKIGTVGGGGGNGKSSEDFSQYLAQYNEWNAQYEYWLAQALKQCGEKAEGKKEKGEGNVEGEASYGLTVLRSSGLENDECATLWGMVSHYSALKDNYFNAIIVEAISNYELRMTNYGLEQGESDDENSYGLTVLRSYGLLRDLFSYRNNYTDNLSIAETYLAENNYTEAFATLAQMYEKFKLTEEQYDELKSLEIYINWLQQLENEQNSIYTLSENQLNDLSHYVESNTGRGVVFAKNILCALYGICEEEVSGERFEIPRSARNDEHKSPSNVKGGDGEASYGHTLLRSYGLEIFPNPGKDHITVVSEVENVFFELIEVTGKIQKSIKLYKGNNTINTSSLQQGIYIYKIIVNDKVVSGKWIKM